MGGTSLGFSTIRLRLGEELLPKLSPYLQVGQELTTIQGHVSSMDATSSYAYVSPGLRFNTGPFSWFAEARLRKFYGSVDEPYRPSEFDARALLVYGDFFQWPLGVESTRFSLFTELYSENIFTSADENNLISGSYVRSGVRYQVMKNVMADLFLEPFLSVDKVRHYYYNRFDVKPSLRALYAAADFNVGLTLSYVWNHYFTRGDREPNPFANTPHGLRALLVIGASL